jgi:hypothetical protein
MERRVTVGELDRLSIDDVMRACDVLDAWQDALRRADAKVAK